MADLFGDIIPSIMRKKKYVLEEENDYNPYVVNRALSWHYDCILMANQMNQMPFLDKKLQYDFYLNRVRAYKRPYQKWQKREITEAQTLIKEYYGYTNEKAREAARVLSDDQIGMIKKKLDRGGVKKNASRNDKK